MSWISSRDKSTPISWAIAGRCNAVFVEPPMAVTTVTAFSNAFFVSMSDGLISFLKRFKTASPAFLLDADFL